MSPSPGATNWQRPCRLRSSVQRPPTRLGGTRADLVGSRTTYRLVGRHAVGRAPERMVCSIVVTDSNTLTASHHPEARTGLPPEPADGRHARRHRATAAVVAATITLFTEGEWNPTAQRIASLAGVSLRSVFRYAESLEHLTCVALGVWEQRFPQLQLAPPDPRAAPADRTRLLATHQTAFWVLTREYRMAARALNIRIPSAGRIVDDWSITTRSNVENYLAPCLAWADDDERQLRLGAADAVMQAPTTDRLYGQLAMPELDVATAVGMLIESALGASAGSRQG